MSLIDKFEMQKKKTFRFNAVRNVRSRSRTTGRARYQWNQRLSPSKMYLEQCVWMFYQDMPPELFESSVHLESDLKDREGKIREDWNYFGYDGTANHRSFQEDLRKANLKQDKLEVYKGLNPNYIDFLPQEKKEKFKNECIELPIWYEYKNLTFSGYVDDILYIPKVSPNPIVGDMKFKHKAHTTWKTYVERELPDPKHFAQVLIYMWIFNQNPNWLQKPVDIGTLGYYNNSMCGELDAEQEFYFKSPLDAVETYIEEQNKEFYCWKERIDSFCTNPFCKIHGKEKIDYRSLIYVV